MIMHVEAVGFSGGICCFWDTELDFHEMSKQSQSQVLHGVFNRGKANEWCLSVVHGHPNHVHRRLLWQQLRSIQETGVHRWCVCGDFNATLREDERASTACLRQGPDKFFSRWVQESGFEDSRTSGTKVHVESWGLFSHLDRALVDSQWLDYFPQVSLLHLPRIKLDHCPLLLKLVQMSQPPSKQRSFKFFEPWVTHEGFPELHSWAHSDSWEEIFAVGPSKAPCPDGLNPLFYQSQWEIVGDSVIGMVK